VSECERTLDISGFFKYYAAAMDTWRMEPSRSNRFLVPPEAPIRLPTQNSEEPVFGFGFISCHIYSMSEILTKPIIILCEYSFGAFVDGLQASAEHLVSLLQKQWTLSTAP
jgi:hypothetical protein